jgi:Leucine-rich repeat (LRR) protein
MSLAYAASNYKTIDLKCDFGTPKCDPEFNACYYCNVKDMVVKERGTRVSSLKQMFSDDSVIDTQILNIENQVVHFLPTGLNKFVRKTKVLKIQSSGLKAIAYNDLKDFHNLKELYVTGNDLKTLPSNLLQIDADIVKVDFSNNKLANVGANFFDSKAIQSASFLGNKCIDSATEIFDFEGVKTLEENLTKSCPPTTTMLVSQINWLRYENKFMRGKLEKCDPKEKSKTTTQRPCRKREEVDFNMQVDMSTICQDEKSLTIFNVRNRENQRA